jgi:hypothetical protein
MGQLDSMQNEVGTNFGNLARQLAVGFSDGSRETAAAQQDFRQNLDNIRTLVNDGNVQVSNEIRQQYNDLSSAFDEQGRLITRSVDANGIQTSRAIDNQGRLLLARFDQNGNRVDQQALDINQMMRALSSSGFVAGANSGMMQGTPSSVPGMFVSSPTNMYDGMMSPYAISR